MKFPHCGSHYCLNISFIFFNSRGRSKLPSHLLHRRHSRASSVDRREIFNKYIQRPGEHSESVKPFVSDDTELCHGEKDRNQDEFLMDPTSNSITVNKVSTNGRGFESISS